MNISGEPRLPRHSVNSSRELYEKQIATEKTGLEMVPEKEKEKEKEELVLIYQAKGLKEAEARALADRPDAIQR